MFNSGAHFLRRVVYEELYDVRCEPHAQQKYKDKNKIFPTQVPYHI